MARKSSEKIIKINVLGWEEYQPRKDIKNPTWFRLVNNLFESPKLYHLNAQEMACFVYLLCQCSKTCSPISSINFAHARKVARISESTLASTINKLESLGVIEIIREQTFKARTDPCTRVRNPYKPGHDNTNNTNKQDNNTTNIPDTFLSEPSPKVTESDFQRIYFLYPRKEGKTAGFKKLKSILKSEQDVDRFILAIGKYKKHLIESKTEERFIKHFSTFVGSWEEWLDENTGKVDDFKAGVL